MSYLAVALTYVPPLPDVRSTMSRSQRALNLAMACLSLLSRVFRMLRRLSARVHQQLVTYQAVALAHVPP